MTSALAVPRCSARMYATIAQISASLYWLPNAGIAVKPRPFFTIQKSCASVFSFAAALVKSVASGYVVGPNAPRPSPFAPWHTAHEPVYAVRPDARARGSFARGFAASPPRTRETTDTAASPYTRSSGRSWRWASANGSARTKTRRSATIAPRAAM